MDRIRVAWSAFSARVLAGRRGVLLVCSALIAAALLAIAWLISRSARETGYEVGVLALADMLAMIMIGAALFVVAPAMVAAQVGEERRSGTLDLLRTAPLSPTALAVGFLAGAPASLYLLLTAPLGLHVVAGLLGVYPLAVLPQSLFVLATGSSMLMLLSLLAALSVGRERAGNAIAMALAGLLAIAGMVTVGMAAECYSARWALVHPAGALAEIYVSFAGPYRDTFVSSWRLEHYAGTSLEAMLGVAPSIGVVLYLVAGSILLVAARRALAGDPPAYLSKPEAIGLFATATAALLVPLRLTIAPDVLNVGYVAGFAFALSPVYIACVLAATPTATGYDPHARRLSARGAPFLTAMLMWVAAFGVLALLFGTQVLPLFDTGRAYYAAGFVGVALTLPIYSLYASTRLGSQGARLAFWAGIAVLMAAQSPSLILVRESHRVAHLLATIGLGLGVAVPAMIAWRQRVGDRRAV